MWWWLNVVVVECGCGCRWLWLNVVVVECGGG